MAGKPRTNDLASQLKILLSQDSALHIAADVIRRTLRETDTDRGASRLRKTLGMTQSTASKFIAGKSAPRHLRENVEKLSTLLNDLKLTVADLRESPSYMRLLLCIDHLDKEQASTNCVSVYFQAADTHAVPFPMDPRMGDNDSHCCYCGETLQSQCPECGIPLVAGPYCPGCGHRYVTDIPEVLRGLTGRRLSKACERLNEGNRIARGHAESDG